MQKLKTLTWYGAFVSFIGYFREKNIMGYALANVFNCLVPAIALWFCYSEKIGAMFGVTLCILYRLIPAPFDKIASDILSFSELRTYPLSFFEKIYIRLSSKFLQISEWFFGAALAFMFSQNMSFTKAIVLALLVLFAVSISEELVYFGIHLMSASILLNILYIILCLGCGVVAFFFGRYISVSFISGALSATTVICLAAIIIAVLTRVSQSPAPFFVKRKGGRRIHIPLSSRILLLAKPKRTFSALFFLELIDIFKIRFMSFISSVVYCIIFFIIDPDVNYINFIIIYFAIEMVFYNGFNYFGISDDRNAVLLFSKLSGREIFRSKNAALATSTFAICATVAIIFGIVFDLGIRFILFTLITSLFAVMTEIMIASFLSVRHFNIVDSPKKYSVKNIIVMLVSVIITSTLSLLLFIGGILTIAMLTFMIPMILICAYFTIIDTRYLESYLMKNKRSMISNIS